MLEVSQHIENIFSNEVANKIKNKKHFLQFLPEVLLNIKDETHIFYKSKKLKVDYLIDIVNSLILKYYFNKKNRYPLYSVILKQRYGYLYNYYINYLIEKDILILKLNYKKNVTSRVYSLNESIFKSKMYRYKNEDKTLIKKYKKRMLGDDSSSSSTVSNNNHIKSHIKNKLISDLFFVNIDMEKSASFVDSLKNEDIDIYNRNLYSINSINKKDIFYHFDNFGRMHTNFTILKSFIRKNYLLIDNQETYEIDISNSQPLFLSKMIYDSNTNWVKEDEFNLFKKITVDGTYYEHLMSKLNIKERKEVKKITYKVFFGKNGNRSKADILFKSVFPTIHKFITLYKKENDNYKILAHHLQRMESNLIFNKIIEKIINQNSNIKILTVHDSIIVPSSFKEEVKSIFENELLLEFNF